MVLMHWVRMSGVFGSGPKLIRGSNVIMNFRELDSYVITAIYKGEVLSTFDIVIKIQCMVEKGKIKINLCGILTFWIKKSLI